jgi:hypothetical protein
MVVFGLALVAAFLLAVFLPDLVPAAAHGEAATVAHARVVSTVQPSPIPSEAPLPSAQPLASAPASPVASDAATAPGQSPAPAPSGQPATGGVQAAPGPGSAGSGEPLQAVVQFIDGPYAGQEGQGIIQGPSGALELPDYRPGDEVVVEIDTAPDGTTSMVLIDRWRLPLLEMLLGAFAVTAAAVAGWRGLRAIAALALTLVLTLRLFVPLVIRGWDPVALAIVFGILVTTLSFMLTQGINRTTLAAIAGTSLGLGVTGVLAAVVTASAHFTPAQGSDQVVYLAQLTNGSIDLSGLLLAAVIFGGLGVLNDVAITQAATVEELHLANPASARWSGPSACSRPCRSRRRSPADGSSSRLGPPALSRRVPRPRSPASNPRPEHAGRVLRAPGVRARQARSRGVGSRRERPGTLRTRIAHGRPVAAPPGHHPGRRRARPGPGQAA